MTVHVARAGLIACSTLWLVSCGAPPTSDTAPAAPPMSDQRQVRPAEPAERVIVTASRQSASSPLSVAPLPAPGLAAPAPPPTISGATNVRPLPRFNPPGADKFPDKEATRSILTEQEPVSTFSVDVDTASYAFLRRMLSNGRMPPPDAVRVEEMVNYFPYHYPRPDSRTRPFAITTEVVPSPWNAHKQLVHIALRGYDSPAAGGQRPPVNAVLLIDVSGSMQPQDRLPLLKQGLRLFVQQLRDQDRVAIVTYASGTRVALEPTTGQDKQKILDALDSLHGGGGTAGGEGLRQAYAMAERHFDAGAVNRVILATDGDFNLGILDPRQLEQFVAAKRKSGVYLSILGVGHGNLNDALMQRLAQSGNGNAAYIDSLLEARKALSEEFSSTMFPIANDVKVQVEFNPAKVAAYRLVGYETRMLQRQDFNDDRIDAGDMGAGHTVTAIYEITPVEASAKLVDPLRYQDGRKAAPAAAKHGDELCFVKARYKLPGESASRLIDHPVRAGAARRSLQEAPADQRFAVAVAAFGQRLRGEAQVGDFSYAQIADLANGARGEDAQGYRAEFVQLVRMAETLDKVGQQAVR